MTPVTFDTSSIGIVCDALLCHVMCDMMCYEMVCDGGWYFPEYCAERGYAALSMEHVKPSSNKAQIIKTDNDYNEEYWLSGRAFVGHQRGGSRHAFRQDPMSVAFYACVETAVGAPTG